MSMLRRRRAEFHGAGRFTRYRYPTKFHQPTTSAWDIHQAPVAGPQRSPRSASFLPASLRTTTRYGQEPTVQSSGQRRRVAGKTRRAKARMVDCACQCSLRVAVANSCCQAGSGDVYRVNRAVSTGHVTYQDAVVMTTRVETMSRMTETDVRLVDLPEIDHLTSKLTISCHSDSS